MSKKKKSMDMHIYNVGKIRKRKSEEGIVVFTSESCGHNLVQY